MLQVDFVKTINFTPNSLSSYLRMCFIQSPTPNNLSEGCAFGAGIIDMFYIACITKTIKMLQNGLLNLFGAKKFKNCH